MNEYGDKDKSGNNGESGQSQNQSQGGGLLNKLYTKMSGYILKCLVIEYIDLKTFLKNVW